MLSLAGDVWQLNHRTTNISGVSAGRKVSNLAKSLTSHVVVSVLMMHVSRSSGYFYETPTSVKLHDSAKCMNSDKKHLQFVVLTERCLSVFFQMVSVITAIMCVHATYSSTNLQCSCTQHTWKNKSTNYKSGNNSQQRALTAELRSADKSCTCSFNLKTFEGHRVLSCTWTICTGTTCSWHCCRTPLK